jgi:hypothetical protein
MSTKLRLFISIVAISGTAIGGLFLLRPHPVSASPRPLFPTYTTGNFTFSSPVEMVRPSSPAFFQQGGEAETKVDIFGNIYVTAIQGVPGGVDLWKSTDRGASFVYMGQPDGAQDHCPSIPQCFGLGGGDDQIDISPGGFLYVSSLWAGNVTMSSSYDGATGGAVPGQAWQVHPAAAGVPSDDRQWVAAYGPQTLGLTYNATSLTRPPGGIGLFFTKSTNAGQTFGPPVEITAATALDSTNVQGNLVVDPYTGNFYTTYIPLNQNNVIRLASSTDGGTTWNVTTAYTGPAGTTNRGVFPIIAIDRGGNLHLVFTQSSDDANHNNCHVFLTSTTNPAAAAPTWTTAVRVDNGPTTNTACQAWVNAGSPGVVNVTWLGQSGSNPNSAPFDWHVFFAQVTGALTGSPIIAQNQATTVANHNAAICFNGAGCAAGTRTMLEYYAMALDREGNANIAFSNSTVNCPSSTCLTNAWFTKQTGGPSAYNPPAPPTPASFAANIVLPGQSGDAEPNMKADSHNCLFSASPGRPDFEKSTDAGASFSLLPNPVVGTGLTGGDEDILPFPQVSGARPDPLYFADLGVATVHISKSTDGGTTWATPGAANTGEVSASVDRQWLAGDRSGANQTVYLWEHEFVSQELRMHALTNDLAWSAPASGITTPELIAPPGSTLSNTNPGPTFVDPATHLVYGFFNASTVTSNAIGAPTGKLPNIWEADGAGTFMSPVPPGPFTNHPVFKGLIDSPTNPAPPAGTTTFGANTGNLFCGAAIDSAGNIYVAWATPNGRTNHYEVWFASSHDHGQSYYGPFLISSGPGHATMPWVAAGDSGKVDIVYYGTADTGDPNSGNDNWRVMFAQSLNAADREPVFSVVTASDHVNHQGPICNVGILCGSGTRQLLDFFQVAIGPDGLANIAYADDGASNGSTHISYARQNGGPLALNNPSAVTCLPGPPPPVSVVSRMTHGTAGTFDINLPLPAGTTPRAVEPRSSGSLGVGNYTLVFTFPNILTSVASASVTAHDPTSGTGTVSTSMIDTGDAHNYIVNLTNVSNAQYITVTLNNVVDAAGNSGNVLSPQLGILIGDTNKDGFVNSADISQTKSQSGQLVGASNFREDLNADGFLNSADISLVKSKSGTALPSTP